MAAMLDLGLNSWLEAEDAAEILEQLPDSAAWDSATSDQRTRALISATRRLSQERYRGTRTDPAQPLAWPRTGASDADGALVDADEVPAGVRLAQAWLALEILAGRYVPAGSGGDLDAYKSVKVGPLEVVLRGADDAAPQDDLPPHVRREIAGYQKRGGATVRLVRG